MAYNKGTFYHEDGKQVIKDATLVVGESLILHSDTAPTAELLAPVGSLCICTAADGVALYINKGTATTPSWKALSTEA